MQGAAALLVPTVPFLSPPVARPVPPDDAWAMCRCRPNPSEPGLPGHLVFLCLEPPCPAVRTRMYHHAPGRRSASSLRRRHPCTPWCRVSLSSRFLFLCRGCEPLPSYSCCRLVYLLAGSRFDSSTYARSGPLPLFALPHLRPLVDDHPGSTNHNGVCLYKHDSRSRCGLYNPQTRRFRCLFFFLRFPFIAIPLRLPHDRQTRSISKPLLNCLAATRLALSTLLGFPGRRFPRRGPFPQAIRAAAALTHRSASRCCYAEPAIACVLLRCVGWATQRIASPTTTQPRPSLAASRGAGPTQEPNSALPPPGRALLRRLRQRRRRFAAPLLPPGRRALRKRWRGAYHQPGYPPSTQALRLK
ncbi:hypothetical protein TCAP_01597 [Tolypocladium capitatum]|uniref:Uncharacterized protein n=1 Tax=Tolypocladium capitatum TaxID=45235 RepID=A0A2K3QLT1_9HYPO|nr:hypothetical protein TCAP_01597 [Tolypocladium capitatum]